MTPEQFDLLINKLNAIGMLVFFIIILIMFIWLNGFRVENRKDERGSQYAGPAAAPKSR
jgi:hypothetical protein